MDPMAMVSYPCLSFNTFSEIPRQLQDPLENCRQFSPASCPRHHIKKKKTYQKSSDFKTQRPSGQVVKAFVFEEIQQLQNVWMFQGLEDQADHGRHDLLGPSSKALSVARKIKYSYKVTGGFIHTEMARLAIINGIIYVMTHNLSFRSYNPICDC